MEVILIAGKTGLFSKEALTYIGNTYEVVLTGQGAKKDEKLPAAVRRYAAQPSDDDFGKAFESRRVRAAWYVTGCADGKPGSDETEGIEAVARACSENRVSRLIVLTEEADPADYRSLIKKWKSPEQGVHPVEIAAVMLPLVSGAGSTGGKLGRIFEAMQEKKQVFLEGFPDTLISFFPMERLLILLLRMTAETRFESGVFRVDGKKRKLKELRELLLTLCPEAVIQCGGVPSGNRKKRSGKGKCASFSFSTDENAVTDGQLTDMYSLSIPTEWDWKAEIRDQYGRFQEGADDHRRKACLKARKFLNRFRAAAAAVLDIAVMFFITQYLAQITSESVYFKIVDVRVLFVVMMGLMHGLWAGIAAALMECVVLVGRYSQIGISGILLFYNVENWIPFVYYITAGVICGYTHQKSLQEKNSVAAENRLIRKKYLFLNDAYEACVRDRRRLETQILSEEETYEKLYGAVRKLSCRTREEVFSEAAPVMRGLLENDSVFLYEIDASGRRAKLLPAFMEGASRHVLDLNAYPDMMNSLRLEGGWKNTALTEGAPMYAAVIGYSSAAPGQRGANALRQISYLATVEKADVSQLSLSYRNHFMILCGLVQEALEKASLRERAV